MQYKIRTFDIEKANKIIREEYGAATSLSEVISEPDLQKRIWEECKCTFLDDSMKEIIMESIDIGTDCQMIYSARSGNRSFSFEKIGVVVFNGNTWIYVKCEEGLENKWYADPSILRIDPIED